MKKATMKIGHLDFLSFPWRLCKKLRAEKCILGRGKSFCRGGGDLQNPEGDTEFSEDGLKWGQGDLGVEETQTLGQ